MLLIPTISLFLLFVDQIASEKLSILTADETGSIWPYLTHHKKPPSSQPQPEHPLNFPQSQPEHTPFPHNFKHHNRHNHHKLHQLSEHTRTNEIPFFNEEAGLSLDQYFNTNNKYNHHHHHNRNQNADHDDDQQTNHRMNDDSLFSGTLEPNFLSSENNNNNHEQATITTTTASTLSRFQSSVFDHDNLELDDPVDLEVDQLSLHKLPPFLQHVITNHLRQTKNLLSHQQLQTTNPEQVDDTRNDDEQNKIAKTDEPQQQVGARALNPGRYVHYDESKNVEIVTLKQDQSINHEALTTTATPSTVPANNNLHQPSGERERQEGPTAHSTYLSSSNNADLYYSKIIQSSPNHLLINDRHQANQFHHSGHLSMIRTGHQEPLTRYANTGLNSFIVAVLIGLGVTGALLAIVNHKMRTFKSRLYSKQQRRSLVLNIVD